MTSRIQSLYIPYHGPRHGNDVLDSLGAGIARLVSRVALWVERDRQRRHLASLDERMLKDIVAVGGDLEWFPMSAAGVSLVIGDVTVSGT